MNSASSFDRFERTSGITAFVVKVAQALWVLAILAGVAQAAPTAPRFGTFTEAQKALAQMEAAEEPSLEGHGWEADDSRAEELRLQLESHARGLRGGDPTDDDDTAHYARGRTLIINIFMDHNGGTWSTTEKETMAARNSVAKDHYFDNAPADANLRFDNQGTNGYWEYTVDLPYNIPEDGCTWAMTEDAAALLFGDADGDGVYVDDLTIWLQNWGGGFDNVLAMFQPADIIGRAFASFGYARTRIYTDDSPNVRAHEWGHLFGSCDEYTENGGCNDCGPCQSWYLPAVIDNENCEIAACGVPVPCIMNDNTFSGICSYTLGHWGWVDGDSNGLLDTVKRRLVGESYVNIYEMGNGGWFLWNNTGHGFSYSQTTSTWSVVGLRSPATADYDLDVFRDYEHRYKVASSVYFDQDVDFVVGDYNHTAESNEHIEVTRYEGASDNYRIHYESGTGVLFPDGVERAGSWGADGVVRVWDVPLFGGESVSFTLDVTSGTTDFGMSLFKSNGAEYFAGRSAAQWTRNAAGDGGTESWTYTVPADDVYGLVIFANNHADCDFTIQIGPAPLTLAEETPIASSLDLRLFNYDPNAVYWSFIGNRPAAADNTTVKLFNDSTYQTELETSNNYNGASPNNVDFIAVDYNHASGAIDYPRVIANVGAGTHRTEWEHDADIIAGTLPEVMWDAGHVGKVWDAHLTDGVPYLLRSYTTTIDQGIYFFRSGDGDYYKQRNAFASGANFRPPDFGEWASYTPTETDWHGIVQIVNDEGSGTYANWIGRKVSMTAEVTTSFNDEVQWGSGSAPANYWMAFGVRPSPSEAAAITLYGDDGYTYTTIKASDQTGAGVVNFVVGDYNHTPPETVYPRMWRTSGVGVMDVEMEGGTETLTFLGADPVSTTQVWPAGDVVEVFDVYLPANTNVRFQLNNVSGDMDLGMALFKSNGAAYYASPLNAVDQADAQTVGGNESFEYFSPAADYYGLVVFNQNDASGTFELIVGASGSTDAAVVSGAAAFDLAAAPNPFVDVSELRFSLPREERVTLAVYDATGRLVRRLMDGAVPAGTHVQRWDGRDDGGQRVAAGVYLARLQSSQEEMVRKLIRMK